MKSYSFLGDFYTIPPTSKEFAIMMDKNDPLKQARDEFIRPTVDELTAKFDLQFSPQLQNSGSEIVYFRGHSVGLQPIAAESYLNEILENVARLGYFAYTLGSTPASLMDSKISDNFSGLYTGAYSDEVVLTSNSNVNFNALLATFFRPTEKRKYILHDLDIEPQYKDALESHVNWHGFDASECLVMIESESNSLLISTNDIVAKIKALGNQIALVWLSGIQFPTGQLLDIPVITSAVHQLAGCPIGWNLDHAIGNVQLKLHDWEIDFAIWSTERYLNASPGAVGGIFVHRSNHHVERSDGSKIAFHGQLDKVPRWTGWWSHRKETRFNYDARMELASGAAAYAISNPPTYLYGVLDASMAVVKGFGGMGPVRNKSKKLTGYLRLLLEEYFDSLPDSRIRVITPGNPDAHGAQLAIYVGDKCDWCMKSLQYNGYLCDMYGSEFLIVTPNPLYNSYQEVFNFVEVLKSLVTEKVRTN